MNNEEVQRYPLSWPVGWKRTRPGNRTRARFRKGKTNWGDQALTVWDGMTRLRGELRRLGGAQELASTNVVLRLDGLPRSGQPQPKDPGAAVYFQLKGKPRCLACDRWDRVADNLAAIAAHISAIRAVDRYGVGTLDQAFAGYAQLRSSAEADWHLVLGVDQGADKDEIEDAFRRLARKHHPDVGGDPGEMVRINQARQAALRELQ